MFLDKFVGTCGRLLTGSIPKVNVVPVRTRYVTWPMLRDVKRRNLAKEHAKDALRFDAINNATVLPEKARIQASELVKTLPRDAFPKRITNRCILTSRGKGLVISHRLSRIMWRLLADYNKMSGVIRAKW